MPEFFSSLFSRRDFIRRNFVMLVYFFNLNIKHVNGGFALGGNACLCNQFVGEKATFSFVNLQGSDSFWGAKAMENFSLVGHCSPCPPCWYVLNKYTYCDRNHPLNSPISLCSTLFHCLFNVLLSGASVLLTRRIAAEIKRQLDGFWTPAYCKNRDVVWQGTKKLHWHFEVEISMHFCYAGFISCFTYVQRR